MKSHTGSGIIRIIGGEFKGRRLKVLSQPDLRPTPDRVRETLFNWLQGYVQDARVIDLFSGTGALAFEALSRGAKHVVLIEHNAKLIPHLKSAVELLQCADRAHIMRTDAVKWLNQDNQQSPFDIIFLDPPFSLDLWAKCLDRLACHQYIHSESLVYLEAPKTWTLPQANFPWEVVKHKVAGQVGYYLLKPVCNSE